MKFIVVSEKKWHLSLFESLKKNSNHTWILINSKDKFTLEELENINPEKIFIPHWSYIIPQSIFSKFECIVFHMTDLPFGRGGSPLQNLIVRGIEFTKISALKVEKGLDTGDIYLKKDLYLFGTAQEIFIRSTKIIFEMISEIIDRQIVPSPQTGKIVNFQRRKPNDGDISDLTQIEQIYDYIRMLDADGYPNAFLENDNFRIEFSRASFKSDNSIIADVRIVKK
jgi:methionyl-tRNA formyltransferase